MLFNSIEFIVFLIIVYLIYRILPHRKQNIFLLIASYFFYGWWDARFLYLIIVSTSVDFSCGLMIKDGKINRNERWITALWLVFGSFLFLPIRWNELVKIIIDEKLNFSSLIYPKGFILACVATIFTILFLYITKILGKLEERKRKKVFLVISVVTNLTILGFFKYFNFFIDNLKEVLSIINISIDVATLSIILPVGISFYTFQTMSYTIDIYRGKLMPTKKFTNFALFVAFFPQLVAGPIERAKRLLPKLEKPRKIRFRQSFEGIKLIIFGLFKKVVIADGVARTVNQVFESQGKSSWLEIVIATFFFSIQIYCDFSGYSSIARGVGKLLGIELMRNFKFPYLSKNPKEFWTRWHISLSSWLRDYLYIPLGGNRKGKGRTYINLILTMLLGGLWHGASWNFVLWGFYHGILLSIHRKISSLFINKNERNIFIYVIKIFIFFSITCYGWMLFRASSLEQIINYTKIFFNDFGNLSFSVEMPRFAALVGLPVLVIIELIQNQIETNRKLINMPKIIWSGLYAVIFLAFLMGMSNESSQFIYFAF